MSFDVGIGKCRSVSGDRVDVWVDSSVVNKIVPDAKWQKAGVSVLRVSRGLCSTQRPVEADEEVFLSSERVGAKSTGLIDYLGSGEFVRVGLAALVPALDERTYPASSRKPGWR